MLIPKGLILETRKQVGSEKETEREMKVPERGSQSRGNDLRTRAKFLLTFFSDPCSFSKLGDERRQGQPKALGDKFA